MLYRARPADGIAWVAGASSGIGRGVALELARRGYAVAASARRADALRDLAAEASVLNGRIEPAPLDMTDREAVARLAPTLETRLGPIALVFLNAGVSRPDPPGDLGGENFRQTFEVNVLGLANGLNAALNAMRPRGRGQIAFNASIAGYGGLPAPAAYGASKAAAIHLAESLKFSAGRYGIAIQVVTHGFVRTPLTAENRFKMPFLMDCETAARRICDGFEKAGFEITFPRRLSWAVKAMNLLPYPLYFALAGQFAPKRSH
ncbi:MAG TPA: SDR family NAD(P)-dependent oxidoreductase [Roseiarcus sp.]|nr:SDR family NAD(P)-dependent oxidoreductase [Roseiarcus sp.]